MFTFAKELDIMLWNWWQKYKFIPVNINETGIFLMIIVKKSITVKPVLRGHSKEDQK